MEGRLLARARAKQETLRAENRAEEDRRRREIAAKIPEIGRIDTALCANLSEMVRIAMRQSARTAQELEKESLALQEKRSALLVQNGYPKDYLDPIYSCPRCRDTGWTDGKICECVQKLYRAEQTRELAPLLKQGDETFENFRLDYYSPVAPASGVSPRTQMERVLRLCRAYAESFGYGVVRDLVGHGIGTHLHEDPQIPNFPQKRRGIRLQPGMTLAIEPMINQGRADVAWLDDDWTVVTEDESLSAHYENTVLITDGEPEILTLSR